MYFSNFPQTLYQINSTRRAAEREYVLMTDITRNVRFKREVLDKITTFDKFVIPENDTIEIVSERLYGTPYLHWVLMLLNNRFDYRRDLPLRSEELECWIEKKYSTLERSKELILSIRDKHNVEQHPRFDITGTTVQTVTRYVHIRPSDPLSDRIPVVEFINTVTGANIPTPTRVQLEILLQAAGDLRPVYAYDLETKSNDEKRIIRTVSSDLMDLILQNFRDLM